MRQNRLPEYINIEIRFCLIDFKEQIGLLTKVRNGFAKTHSLVYLIRLTLLTSSEVVMYSFVSIKLSSL